jgi:hypothetical protein
MILAMAISPTLMQARQNANVYPLEKQYYRMNTLAADLTDLAAKCSGTASLVTLGVTQAGNNPIYALHIQRGEDRIPVLIIGQHHGEEVLGVEIAMGFAKKLLLHCDDASVRNLLGKYSFWIIPTLNPDAWDIVTSGRFQWKRKNNTDTNNNGKLDMEADGVDLNRNYPTFWEEESPFPPSSPFYRGPFPASENEVKALLKLTSEVSFRYAFLYHSSIRGTLGETIYLPWQDFKDKSIARDFLAMRRLAKVYAASVPKDYSRGNYKVYSGNTSKLGNARNYLFYEKRAYAFDIEVGGVGNLGTGIIHPEEDRLETIIQKNIRGLLTALQMAN